MKRWLKRIGLCAGVLCLLGFIFVLAAHLRGHSALNQRLEALRAQGQKLSAKELNLKRPAGEENAIVALRPVWRKLKVAVPALDDAPPSLRFAAPGQVVVAAPLQEWVIARSTNTWQRVAPQLEHAATLLAGLHAALQKPAYDNGIEELPLVPRLDLQRMAQLLQAAVLHDLGQRQPAAAFAHLSDLLQLIAHQQSEPYIVCQLVRQNCGVHGFAATWQALQSAGFDQGQLASLQAAWEKCDFAGAMPAAFAMDQALELDTYADLRDSDEDLTSPGLCPSWLYGPLWRFAWSDQDELRTLIRWQVMSERERIARTNSWTALPVWNHTEDASAEMPWRVLFEHAEDLGRYDRYRYLLSGDSFSVTDIIIRGTLRAQVQQQMAVTAIALQRYRLRNGKLPADLGALVPDLLKTLPRDSMDGKTLRYKLQPDGGFLLYSVGEDGKDDGGSPAPADSATKFRSLSDGRDTVWPKPASPAEAAQAAMKPPGK